LIGPLETFIFSISVQTEGVASAVYEMNWFESDPRFKKMLILIALRAQKPVCLKATVFLDISMETMSMVSCSIIVLHIIYCLFFFV